ncbi:MAG: polyribonucleotide nucleotidyltransferase [Clostridiales bacterium]|nr:MAG: polyribonucleotide nucleotidyltransferase [Clostridiales bacterium]
MYANERTFETTFAGRPLVVETGKFAGLANGSCMIRYGDTCVLATATASAKPRDGIDYFPLAVDYEEKLYSVGKIPGGFLKREGKPSEKAILASRVIDRPFRPLFPKDMRNDVVVSTTLMAVDNDYPPEIAAMIGASIAISISDIPWNGPVAGLSLGYVDGEYVFNPTSAQRAASEMAVTVAATEEKIVMIEAGANEIPDDIMLKGIIEAHKELKKMCQFIKSIQSEIGKPKFSYNIIEVDHDLYDDVKTFAYEKIEYCLDTDDKDIRDARLLGAEAEIVEALIEKYPEIESSIGEVLYKLQKEIVRKWLFEDHRRVDGRTLDEIRPLHAEVGVLPRVHGSGLFSRGQTQVLTIATLGLVAEKQKLDGIDDEDSKRYMHHYNMPGYSVGDAKSSRGAGRREIGHGALAERSLEPVLPSEEEFPYAIRLVSEVLSSNGSTSQGSVCGSTLALMDAGVPIKAPVAGISCGLITRGDEWETMIDIQGLEDFYGDMDFKVAGTKKGITSIQVDIKIDGLTYEMIEKAFEVTRAGRIKIIDEVILNSIPAPRETLSPFAPKIITYGIPTDKIREVIGTGGKVIQKIIADTGVKIDIEDDGKAYICYIDEASGKAALETIKMIVEGPQVGKLYYGKVVRIMEFGAFVEIAPGKDGLVHISKLDEKRVNKVEDVVSVGDEIWVKVVEIDRMGRINLSRKDALKEMSENKEETAE